MKKLFFAIAVCGLTFLSCTEITSSEKAEENQQNHTETYLSQEGSLREVVSIQFSKDKKEILSGTYWVEGSSEKSPITFNDVDYSDEMDFLMGIANSEVWEEELLFGIKDNLSAFTITDGKTKKTFTRK